MENLFRKLINRKIFDLEIKEVNYPIESMMNDCLADNSKELFKQKLDNY